MLHRHKGSELFVLTHPPLRCHPCTPPKKENRIKEKQAGARIPPTFFLSYHSFTMLPQLSFILAQAGADAHLPPLSGSSSSSNTRHSPQPSSSLSQHVLPPPPAHPPLFTSSSSSSSPTPSDHQLPPLAFLKWRDTERPVLPPPSSLWRTSPPPSAQPVASSSSFSAAAAPAEPSLTECAPIYDYDPYHSQYETHWDQGI